MSAGPPDPKRPSDDANDGSDIPKDTIDILSRENQRLAKENSTMRQFIQLTQENCELQTLNYLTFAMSMHDVRLRKFIRDVFSSVPTKELTQAEISLRMAKEEQQRQIRPASKDISVFQRSSSPYRDTYNNTKDNSYGKSAPEFNLSDIHNKSNFTNNDSTYSYGKSFAEIGLSDLDNSYSINITHDQGANEPANKQNENDMQTITNVRTDIKTSEQTRSSILKKTNVTLMAKSWIPKPSSAVSESPPIVNQTDASQSPPKVNVSQQSKQTNESQANMKSAISQPPMKFSLNPNPMNQSISSRLEGRTRDLSRAENSTSPRAFVPLVANKRNGRSSSVGANANRKNTTINSEINTRDSIRIPERQAAFQYQKSFPANTDTGESTSVDPEPQSPSTNLTLTLNDSRKVKSPNRLGDDFAISVQNDVVRIKSPTATVEVNSLPGQRSPGAVSFGIRQASIRTDCMSKSSDGSCICGFCSSEIREVKYRNSPIITDQHYGNESETHYTLKQIGVDNGGIFHLSHQHVTDATGSIQSELSTRNIPAADDIPSRLLYRGIQTSTKFNQSERNNIGYEPIIPSTSSKVKQKTGQTQSIGSEYIQQRYSLENSYYSNGRDAVYATSGQFLSEANQKQNGPQSGKNKHLGIQDKVATEKVIHQLNNPTQTDNHKGIPRLFNKTDESRQTDTSYSSVFQETAQKSGEIDRAKSSLTRSVKFSKQSGSKGTRSFDADSLDGEHGYLADTEDAKLQSTVQTQTSSKQTVGIHDKGTTMVELPAQYNTRYTVSDQVGLPAATSTPVRDPDDKQKMSGQEQQTNVSIQLEQFPSPGESNYETAQLSLNSIRSLSGYPGRPHSVAGGRNDSNFLKSRIPDGKTVNTELKPSFGNRPKSMSEENDKSSKRPASAPPGYSYLHDDTNDIIFVPIATSSVAGSAQEYRLRRGSVDNGVSLAEIVGFTGEGAEEKANFVLYRPVDQLTGYRPVITLALFKLLKIYTPSKRLVGEVAFQLDRRIMEFIFAGVSGASPNRSRFRYYGYSLTNVHKMIVKEANRGDTHNAVLETLLRNRYDTIMTRLYPFGYNFAMHAAFTQDIVNKYGLLHADYEEGTSDIYGMNSAGIIRLKLGKILGKNPEELRHMLIIFDCLCYLAFEDERPIFIW